MKKHITEQQNAPLGVSTSATLPKFIKSCYFCKFLSTPFDCPFCLYFEKELDLNAVHHCENFEIYEELKEDLPF